MKWIFIVFFIFTGLILPQTKGIISGKVTDKFTKQPVPGVNILVEGTTTGAASNLSGEFVIEGVEPGSYRLRATAIGYESLLKTDIVVNTARPVFVTFEMLESVIELEGITIKSEYFEKNPTEVNSIASFSYEEIRRSPGGFEDVVRALSVLPGVAQQSAGRNDLVVRGGAPSENLYIVDGFIIPNINHFGNQGATGGPLSYINLDFVQQTEFSSGGFSALHGDKLSSVLKIDLRNGRTDKIGGKATISASQFGLNLEGPAGSGNSFIFSARRSYLDFIFKAAGFGFVPEYWDFLGKFDMKADNANQFSFLFIGAIDRVNFNNSDRDKKFDNARILGSNQNQYIAGISYRHLYSKSLLNISLSRNFTDFDSNQRDTLLNPVFQNKSAESENELKADYVYKLSSSSELNAGLSAKYIQFSGNVILPSFITSFGDTLSINNLNVEKQYFKNSAFIQYTTILFHRLNVNAGLRYDYFNGISDGNTFNPRLSLSYMFSDRFTVSASSGIYSQFPSYIWLTAEKSNKNLKPVKTYQYILGAEYKLMSDLRIKAEGFFKDYSDYPVSSLREYLILSNTGAGFGGSDDNYASFGLDPLVSKGKGKVTGVEISLQKKASDTPLYGILSFTYSKSRFKALDGIERPGNFDQSIILSLAGGYIFNKNWEANFKFRYANGRPYTPFNENGRQDASEINSKRLPATHSLDLRVDRRWNFEGWNLIAYIDVQNIYGRKNVSNIRWDFKENKPEENQDIGLLPSIGISVEF
ncbi:MAG: TonB-dependent receptor [Ignavibacteria bacterium]|nr:TonB-dependent receptor [Ignavibacteria bacterium]